MRFETKYFEKLENFVKFKPQKIQNSFKFKVRIVIFNKENLHHFMFAFYYKFVI